MSRGRFSEQIGAAQSMMRGDITEQAAPKDMEEYTHHQADTIQSALTAVATMVEDDSNRWNLWAIAGWSSAARDRRRLFAEAAAAGRRYLSHDEVSADLSALANSDPDDVAAWKFTGYRLYPQAAQRAEQAVMSRHQASLDQAETGVRAVFPQQVAEVRPPDWCRPTPVPSVVNWQHAKGLSAKAADKKYLQLSQQAADRAVEQLRQPYQTPPDLGPTDQEAAAVCESQDDVLLALQNQYAELSRQALPVVLAQQHQLSPSVAVMAEFCEAVRRHAPAIQQLRTKAQCWFRRPDEPIVAELATELAKQLWQRTHGDRFDEQLKQQAEQVMAEALEWLAQQLQDYQASPSTATATAPSEQPSRSIIDQRRPSAKPEHRNMPAAIELPGQLVPWMDSESNECAVLIGEVPGVLVLDCRTDDLRKIEHAMAGYETDKAKQTLLPKVRNRLELYAKTADLGRVKTMRRLTKSDQSAYPYTIWYSKTVGRNTSRVYASYVEAEHLSQHPDLQQQLTELDVQRLLLFVGACDKQHQIDALIHLTGRHLTGRTRQRVKNAGAGSN